MSKYRLRCTRDTFNVTDLTDNRTVAWGTIKMDGQIGSIDMLDSDRKSNARRVAIINAIGYADEGSIRRRAHAYWKGELEVAAALGTQACKSDLAPWARAALK